MNRWSELRASLRGLTPCSRTGEQLQTGARPVLNTPQQTSKGFCCISHGLASHHETFLSGTAEGLTMTKAARVGRGGGLAFLFGVGLAGAGLAAATGTAASAWASPPTPEGALPARRRRHTRVSEASRCGPHLAAQPCATRSVPRRVRRLPNRQRTFPARLREFLTRWGRSPRRPACPSAKSVTSPAAAAVSAPVARQVGVAGPFANYQRTITILPKFRSGFPGHHPVRQEGERDRHLHTQVRLRPSQRRPVRLEQAERHLVQHPRRRQFPLWWPGGTT